MANEKRWEELQRGLDLCGFSKGAAILEVGSGEGDRTAYLEGQGFSVTGIETDLRKIGTANGKGLSATFQFGSGDLLDSFLSYTFDGVIAEDAYGMLERPDEAIHEAWCVLKKGGRLLIKDWAYKNPPEKLLSEVAEEAKAEMNRPKEAGECEDKETEEDRQLTPFLYRGTFFLDPLVEYMKEIGYEITTLETGLSPTEEALAEAKRRKPEKNVAKEDREYFLLVAAKPE